MINTFKCFDSTIATLRASIKRINRNLLIVDIIAATAAAAITIYGTMIDVDDYYLLSFLVDIVLELFLIFSVIRLR